ncbi:MAG: hypothetical protein V1870_05405 [Candidatus Aenigmatarchaeota archaeon]
MCGEKDIEKDCRFLYEDGRFVVKFNDREDIHVEELTERMNEISKACPKTRRECINHALACMNMEWHLEFFIKMNENVLREREKEEVII